MTAKTQTKLVLVGEDKTGRAFASAGANAGELDKKMGGIGKQAALVGGAFAAMGIAAVASLVKMVDASITMADNIAKTADSIGISTDSLQEYRFAAERAGVASGQLDGAFQAFGKRLGELRVGTGALTTFLDKYSKSLKQSVIETKSTDEAIGLLLAEMAAMTDQSKRAALGAAAFGRSAGVLMANMVKKGTQSIEDMRQRARDLGLVLEEEFVRNAETARDRIDELGAVIKTTFTRVVIQNADEIAHGVQDIITALVALGKFSGAIGLNALEREKKALEEINSISARLTSGQLFSREEIARMTGRMVAAEGQYNQAIRDQEELLIKTAEGETRRANARATVGAGKSLGPTKEQMEEDRATRREMLAEIKAERDQTRADDDESDRVWRERRLDATKGYADEALRRYKENSELKKRIDEAEVAAKERAEKRKTDAARAGMTALQNLQIIAEAAGKRGFKVAQQAAIAQTIMATAQSAVSSYNAMVAYVGGPWGIALGIAAAAAAVGAGLVQIQKIRSQKYGGGGGGGGGASYSGVGGGGAGGGPPPVANVPTLQPAQAAAVNKVVNLTVVSESGVFTDAWVRENLIPTINEAVGDGVTLNATPG